MIKQEIASVDQEVAEERLHVFERRGGPFVAAVEATRMPMVVTDPTVSGNPIIYVNQAFIDLFGYTREEVLGQNYFFLAGTTTIPLLRGTSEPQTQRIVHSIKRCCSTPNLDGRFGPPSL